MGGVSEQEASNEKGDASTGNVVGVRRKTTSQSKDLSTGSQDDQGERESRVSK